MLFFTVHCWKECDIFLDGTKKSGYSHLLSLVVYLIWSFIHPSLVLGLGISESSPIREAEDLRRNQLKPLQISGFKGLQTTKCLGNATKNVCDVFFFKKKMPCFFSQFFVGKKVSVDWCIDIAWTFFGSFFQWPTDHVLRRRTLSLNGDLTPCRQSMGRQILRWSQPCLKNPCLRPRWPKRAEGSFRCGCNGAAFGPFRPPGVERKSWGRCFFLLEEFWLDDYIDVYIDD